MIRNQVLKIIKEIDGSNISLLTPKISEHGDFAFHISQFGEDSQKVMDIIDRLSKNGLFEKVEQKDSFINLYVSKKILLDELALIIEQKQTYGSNKLDEEKTLVIDYSAPNIAKRFGFGHLRSTVIGQALYNLYSFLGWKVIGDNHLGDWGTQFGKMIVAIRQWADKPIEELSVDEMEALYVKFHDEAEKNPELDDQARLAFKKLEEGNPDEREIWQQLVKNSMLEFQKIYDLLGVNIDFAFGESSYEKAMENIIALSKEKKISKESEGALIVPFADKKTPPAMLLKKDGATTYFTRDLATIQFRVEKWQPDLILYEVGAEQTLHFKQVFWASEMLGLINRENLFHIPHGLIRLKEGKMSTRKGRNIKLDDILNEIVEKATVFNDDPHIAKVVGISALKYNDLKRSPTTGYIFDPNEALSLEGNSGPYLLYTYARIQSVIVKASSSVIPLKKGIQENGSLVEPGMTKKLQPEEISLLRALFRFPELVEDAASNFAPHLLCTYLFDIAQKYSIFYETCPILKAEENIKQFRLILSTAVGQVLKNGLNLLGIEVVDHI